MIPMMLRMRNFMCYGEQESSLDFSGIHLACLAGDNGHGKSAIVDAMTWALWGKARAQRDDDLVHLGASDMEVELEFVLADNHYRVLRHRKKNGAKGHTMLEFQILDNGQFRSLTGNSARQTQATITEVLRMEYETFINSAFLLQGRADEFTAHPPADRKRILGEILDFSQYDRLEEKAKERVREMDVQLREIGASLGEIERELARRPEYERELGQAEELSSRLRSELQSEETKLQDLRQQRRELQLRQDQLNELVAEKEKRDSELTSTRREIQQTENKITSYQAVLDREEEIEEGYSALASARRAEEDLSRKLAQQASLNEERSQVQRAIDGARAQLSMERERLAARVRSLEEKINQAEQTERKLEQVREGLTKLAQEREQREKLLDQEQGLSSQIGALKAMNDQLRSEMDHLKEKLDLLEEADVSCPLCGSDLQAEERDQITENYTREGKEKGDLYRENAASIQQLQLSLQETRQARENSDAALAALASLQGEEVSLATAVDAALAAKPELKEVRGQLALLDQRLESDDLAHHERERLALLDGEVALVGYSAAQHEEVRRTLADTNHFEKDKRDLDTAREGLKAETESLSGREARLATIEQALEDSTARIQALTDQVVCLEDATKDLESRTTLVEQLQVKDADARVRLGAARQKLDHCSYLELQKEDRVLQERTAREEKAIYEELRLAFGKKGIQAMIIEAVIPEIEEEANRLLGRMTDGRLNVRLKSQRVTLKGKTVETLDIEVADELGPRDYGLFSGGEAFRINFAIRVALSKLLARRAGARLQTLIIDEGFGTQDSQGRERLVEAINSVQDDFDRILVITHIEELKDSFPVRIDIFKTPQGSQISVA